MTGKRLLIVGNDLGYFLTHRLPLALAAVSAGYDVHVAIPILPGEQQPNVTGVELHPILLRRGGMNLLQDTGTFLHLFRLYRRLNPDIVHHFTIKPVLYGGWAARLASVPVVIHAMTGLGSMFSGTGAAARVLRRLIIAGLRLSSTGNAVRMVFQNREDRDLFVELGICRRDRCTIIRGSGVDVAMFQPGREPDGVPTVVFPSRMLWEKGIGEFVDAARRLKGNASPARFILVGSTDPNPSSVPEEQLKDWEREGVIEWWGRRDDMPSVLGAASIVCLPSKYREGVPKVLIEAASAGRPIVTTDMPGCRDIVNDGVNGILVPPADAEALACAIERLLGAPETRRCMGEAGRSRVVEHFSLDKVVGQTLDLYATGVA
jgi:glycosyltransferase involved in cell wall biosynthesis